MARAFEDKRSPHVRIAAGLRRGITRGDLAPGAQLPSTPALMEEYGVAGTTVQKALATLKEEGLLRGQPGKGVFVEAHSQQVISPASYAEPAAAGESYRWISEAEKRGQQGTSKLLDVAVVQPPVEVARALGLGEGGQALLRKQILYLDSEPTELVRSYYPLALVDGTAMMERRRIRGGTPTLLAELGYPPRAFADELSAEVATEEEAVALELPRGLPVLLTFRVVYSDGDQPIEVSLLAKAGHRYRMRYETRVG